MTIGDFTIITAYFNMLLTCTSYFLNLGKEYQQAMVSYSRIREILNTPKEINGSLRINSIESIHLRNIKFSYEGKQIITNFNYTFKKGKIYCILGENGCGKSTLLDLMIGLNYNYSGMIYYNNHNIKDIDMYYVRKKVIGITEQEPSLMNTTIDENIRYGTEDISKHDINEWCKRFELEKFIKKLPNQLESYIVENSNNISGGEKQKLSLIRTLIKNTDVIIFDEPTSALDKRGVEIFKDIITDIKYNKIIIFITHNMELLDIADEKIYMK